MVHFRPDGRTFMSHSRVDIEDIMRLYYDEKLTLREVGERLGISRQAVHIRLKSIYGETRPSGNVKNPVTVERPTMPLVLRRRKPPVLKIPKPPKVRPTLTHDDLVRLYVREKLSQGEIAQKIGCDKAAVIEALEKFGIELRRRPVQIPERYDQLLRLELNESVTMDVTDLFCPIPSMKALAKRNGIKFSFRMVKRFDTSRYQITRVA